MARTPFVAFELVTDTLVIVILAMFTIACTTPPSSIELNPSNVLSVTTTTTFVAIFEFPTKRKAPYSSAERDLALRLEILITIFSFTFYYKEDVR